MPRAAKTTYLACLSRAARPWCERAILHLAMSRADILAAALALEPSERVALSIDLLESLEAVEDDSNDIEAAWEAEIDRRVEEIERGEVESVPAEEVFARYGLTFWPGEAMAKVAFHPR